MASESIEMYLVATALLRQENEPVPLSLLAQRLAITPVSANEMCRKLTERGLVEYQPYKGVTLTDAGEIAAQRVLRRRRLWETFLVRHLGIEPEEADELACLLEHITSDHLVERLASFLTCPTEAMQLEQDGDTGQLLKSLTAGQSGRIMSIKADEVVQTFLQAHGVVPGIEVHVLAVAADGAVLLALPDAAISLAQIIAEQIVVAPFQQGLGVLAEAPASTSEYDPQLRREGSQSAERSVT